MNVSSLANIKGWLYKDLLGFGDQFVGLKNLVV